MLLIASGLRLRECDEGCLVFEENSGKTSLLNRQGAEILQTLFSTRHSDDASLRARCSVKNSCNDEQFESLISSLENSGLITRY